MLWWSVEGVPLHELDVVDTPTIYTTGTRGEQNNLWKPCQASQGFARLLKPVSLASKEQSRMTHRLEGWKADNLSYWSILITKGVSLMPLKHAGPVTIWLVYSSLPSDHHTLHSRSCIPSCSRLHPGLCQLVWPACELIRQRAFTAKFQKDRKAIFTWTVCLPYFCMTKFTVIFIKFYNSFYAQSVEVLGAFTSIFRSPTRTAIYKL